MRESRSAAWGSSPRCCSPDALRRHRARTGPTQVLTLTADGSELVVAGVGCTFTRMPDG
ncbi:MAG TPA: hypothetical protein VN408_40320 [Actinoplanes sp.]|nr:hypothetical protein [Actinoplanes sp.]